MAKSGRKRPRLPKKQPRAAKAKPLQVRTVTGQLREVEITERLEAYDKLLDALIREALWAENVLAWCGIVFNTSDSEDEAQHHVERNGRELSVWVNMDISAQLAHLAVSLFFDEGDMGITLAFTPDTRWLVETNNYCHDESTCQEAQDLIKRFRIPLPTKKESGTRGLPVSLEARSIPREEAEELIRAMAKCLKMALSPAIDNPDDEETKEDFGSSG